MKSIPRKTILRFFTALAWLVSVVWFIIEPGFEPLTTFLAGTVSLLLSFWTDNEPISDEFPKNQKSQSSPDLSIIAVAIVCLFAVVTFISFLIKYIFSPDIRQETLIPILLTPTPSGIASMNLVQRCQNPFHDIEELLTVFDTEKDLKMFSDLLIEDSEFFLNHCINFTYSIIENSRLLDQLAKAADETLDLKMMFDVIDINEDGEEEIIAHTSIPFCTFTFGNEGFSILFFRDTASDAWIGNAIWLCSGLEKPKIMNMKLHDTKGNLFLLVYGYWVGADASWDIIFVYRWKSDSLEVADSISISLWCEQPIDWQITDEGFIFIPAAEASEMCAFRPAELHILEGDNFIIKNP